MDRVRKVCSAQCIAAVENTFDFSFTFEILRLITSVLFNLPSCANCSISSARVFCLYFLALSNLQMSVFICLRFLSALIFFSSSFTCLELQRVEFFRSTREKQQRGDILFQQEQMTYLPRLFWRTPCSFRMSRRRSGILRPRLHTPGTLWPLRTAVSAASWKDTSAHKQL